MTWYQEGCCQYIVYVGGFFHLGSRDEWSYLPAAQLALRHINFDLDYLYRLWSIELIANVSTKGTLQNTFDILNDYLQQGQPKIMFLLPSNELLSKAIAGALTENKRGVMQFGYGSTEHALSRNRFMYPSYYRTNKLLLSYNRARIKMVQYYQWTKVAMIYHTDQEYAEINRVLVEELKAQSIDVVINEAFTNDPSGVIKLFKELDVHVILGTFPEKYARKVFCEAYKSKMYGPLFVWIMLEKFSSNWFKPVPSDKLDCGATQLACASQNHFSFNGQRTYYYNGKTISQQTAGQVKKQYNAMVSRGNQQFIVGAYIYDVMWAMADIIKRAKLKLDLMGLPLNRIQYGDERVENIMNDETRRTNFIGITGKVSFYSNGNRKFEIMIYQQQLEKNNKVMFVKVGKFDADKESYTPYINVEWQGGSVYRPVEETRTRLFINRTLFTAYCVLCSLGLLCSLLIFIVLIICRNSRSMENSKFWVDLSILIGCLLNLASVVVAGLDYRLEHSNEAPSIVNISCKVYVFLFSLGFTFSVGGLVTKGWVTFRFSIDKHVYKQKYLELRMLGGIGFLLLVDLTVLLLWEFFDPLHGILMEYDDKYDYECGKEFRPYIDNPFKTNIQMVEHCSSTQLTFWLLGFVTYKCLVLLFGLFLASQSKETPVPGLDGSLRTSKCLLFLGVVAPIGMGCVLGTARIPTMHYGLGGGFTMLCSVIILAVTFSSKMRLLACKPRSRRLEQHPDREMVDLVQNEVFLSKSDKKKIGKLRANLRAAERSRNIEELNMAIKQARDSKYQGLSKDITSANQVLRCIVAGISLQDSIVNRSLDGLTTSLSTVRQLGLEYEYRKEIQKAEKIIKNLKELHRLRQQIQQLEYTNIAEIRSYVNPPTSVQRVMMAVYYLLGKSQAEVSSWRNMQVLLGKIGRESLKRQTAELDPADLEVERVDFIKKHFINNLDYISVRESSIGAATFFLWCLSMTEEVYSRTSLKDEQTMLTELEDEPEIVNEQYNQ